MRNGLEHCELCIQSDDPVFLNIPWELINDPTPGRGYLALSLKGFYRQHTGHKIETFPELSAGEPFRILLIISRPYGKKDVPFHTVARPMLQALQPLRQQIHLEVLRPPTFQALTEQLTARRGYYHIVHFDGHGVFAQPTGTPSMQFGVALNEGHLVFEKDDGTHDIINSTDLGQLLTTGKVPLFVLNACQSAEEGKKNPYSSVASQLVATGAKGVVGMSYSIYATAATKFMQQFYKSLVQHAMLTEAVAASRRSLYADSRRESVIGPLELRDWMVPILYQQEYEYLPIPTGTGVAVAKEDVKKDAQQQVAKKCPEGQFGFIGRDYDILHIERGFRDDRQPVILLTGVGGIGKTELAYGFARWYWETAGCPGGVFCTSFKEKASFAQVIGSIVGFGTDFSRLPEEKQWHYLTEYLKEKPCLLIWDNFETVEGYPKGATPLAPEEERGKLSRFLRALRGGKSRVLITTRKPSEDWLAIGCERVELAGLNERDAAQLAKVILKTVGRKPEDFRDDPNYSRLIGLLKGHPRSLEVVLPLLRNRAPIKIIEALQHRVKSLREAIKDASLSLAFSQLSPKTRKHLPLTGLFASYVHTKILETFVGGDKRETRLYEDLVGESLKVEDWETVLEEATYCGILRSRGSQIYELHPTLGPFLRQQLTSLVKEEGVKRLNDVFMKLYGSFAADFHGDVAKGNSHAVIAIRVEEANLLRALHLAEKNEEWIVADAICHTLYQFYTITGRVDEWRTLHTRILGSIGREISVNATRERASLWMFLLGDEGDDAVRRLNKLEIAESAHKKILDYLTSLHDSAVEPHIATAYHQLGIICQRRNELDKAEEWYRKSLEIEERLKLERDAASDYHQLGMICQMRNELDKAEEWYRKALEVFEHTGHLPFMVNTLAQFGLLRRQQNQSHEAVSLLGRALAIAIRYNMREGWQILVDLARLMKEIGEKEFTIMWQRAFKGEKPPLDILKKILKTSKGKTQ